MNAQYKRKNNYKNYNCYKKPLVKKKKMSYLDNITKDYKKKSTEIKTVDWPYTETGRLVQSPATFLLNRMVSGTEFWNRIGKEIRMKSIHTRIQFYTNPGVTPIAKPYLLRYIVFYDRQTSNTPPVFTDVIQNVDWNGIVDNYRWNFPNMKNSHRFVILRDKIISIANNDVAGLLSNTVTCMIDGETNKTYFDDYIPLKGLPTIYGNNDPTSVEINTGGLYLWIFSDSPGIEIDNSTFQARFTARLRFYDN